tara:strand:- start:1156 stop:1422 length:267 start_codon:yes stop_codon:yes gene_type:complete
MDINNIGLYGVRFDLEQTAIINKFFARLVCCESVTIHKLGNGLIEVYTYQENRNNLSYDQSFNFKNKNFFIGYLHAINETSTGNIYTI